jgi:hypothetical protein
MTPFYSYRDQLHGLTGGDQSPFALRLRTFAHRAASRATAVVRMIHRSIVTAKMRRLQRELMLHAENDAARLPQQPLILDDKWDS